MTEELWKDVPNYEGLYQASTLGRIRSLDKEIKCYPTESKPYTRILKGRILKPYCDSKGFRFIGLHKNGVSERMLVHRLVAITFLENPMDYRDVVFKDGDKSNMIIDNLMWINHSDAMIKGRRKLVY